MSLLFTNPAPTPFTNVTFVHKCHPTPLTNVRETEEKDSNDMVKFWESWANTFKTKKFLLTLKKKIFMPNMIPTLTCCRNMDCHKSNGVKDRDHRTLLGTNKDARNKLEGQTKKRCNKTNLPDASQMIKTLKWKSTGDALRAKNNWTSDIMKWNPNGKRKRGRPKTRWTTDLVKYIGNDWAEIAEDRELWSIYREAFVQQWNIDGWQRWWFHNVPLISRDAFT